MNSIGQILGWDDPRRCDDPNSPKCSKIGVEFRGRDRNKKALTLYTGKFRPLNGGFTGKTPPDGGTIGVNESLTVETESETVIDGVAVEIEQTHKWQPRTRQVGSRIRVRAGGRSPARLPELTILEGKLKGDLGCQCDPPGPFERPQETVEAWILEFRLSQPPGPPQ